jgi:hypothetical protein
VARTKLTASLEAAFDAVFEHGSTLFVDLSETTFIDSAVIGLLVSPLRRIEDNDVHRPAVVAPRGQLSPPTVRHHGYLLPVVDDLPSRRCPRPGRFVIAAVSRTEAVWPLRMGTTQRPGATTYGRCAPRGLYAEVSRSSTAGNSRRLYVHSARWPQASQIGWWTSPERDPDRLVAASLCFVSE